MGSSNFRYCGQCKQNKVSFCFAKMHICKLCEFTNKSKSQPQSQPEPQPSLSLDELIRDFNSTLNLSDVPSVESIKKAARLAGKYKAQNSMLSGGLYCSTPGCVTKLKNQYASICCYCKSKQGWYK